MPGRQTSTLCFSHSSKRIQSQIVPRRALSNSLTRIRPIIGSDPRFPGIAEKKYRTRVKSRTLEKRRSLARNQVLGNSPSVLMFRNPHNLVPSNLLRSRKVSNSQSEVGFG